nr:unnamed protein product [Spirometra erinaceieuropaei]
MLVIRTALKPDLECSAAELVYGTTLRIPGDFFEYSQSSGDLDPSDYVQRLRQAMTHPRATPPRPSTKTWLTQHVDDRELVLSGYQMFRRNWEGRQGGGVLTYVKNGLSLSDKTDNFSCSSEAIWLSIKLPSSPSLDVLTVYRPPRLDNMADARLREELEKLATRPDILIMGDFNAPHID